MVLEKHLKSRSFVVGDAVTLADIALVCALLLPMKFVYEAKERKAFPSVMKWFNACVAMPQFAAVIGHVALCEKSLAPAPVKAAKKEKAKKEKKKAAPAAAPKPKKKAKNPLDLLPKSSLSLDAWKKQYSNATPDCYAAMPWFWENFDSEGYSIYFSTYNYNDENKVSFMVSNLVGGFVQRCDAVRKYAFGTLQIIGKEGGPMEIVGAWIMRGDKIDPLIEANPDAEYHTYTKVDINDAAQKKRFEHIWCAEEELDGKPILDCKVFK